MDLRHAGSGKGGELAGPGGDVLCQIVDNEGFPDSGGCFRSLCCSRRGFLRLPGRLERQSPDSPFRREFLGDGRDRKPLFLPHTENIRQAASSALPHVDEVEHPAEGGVPGIGNSAAAGVLDGDAKGSRIGKSDFFPGLSDGNADGAAVISVDKAVGQGLPQGVLDRGRFRRRGKSAADAEIEIVQAAAPIAGGGDNASCLVEFSSVLLRNRQILVVQEIAGKFPDDFIFVSEHEKSGGGRTEAVVRRFRRGAQLVEKFRGIKILPDMLGMSQNHAGAVAADGVRVEDMKAELREGPHIRRFPGGVPEHGFHLFFGAAVVPFAISLVGAGEGISIDIDRAVLAFCPGNRDGDNLAALYGLHGDVLIGENVHAGLFRAVQKLQKFLDQTPGIRKADRAQGFVRFLHDAQQDNAAQRVGKGRVGLPDAFWQAAQGLFRLNPVVFSVLLQS